MTEEILIYLASIILMGIGAQWIAWRLGLPSILILLILGLIAGPLTGFLKPDELLGNLLVPFVSLSVAVILFEGGLNLKIDELREIGVPVRNLITIGLLTTWVMSSLAAYFILDLATEMAILLGSILVVTGPTVVLPILIQVQPKGKVGNMAKWEGIMNDPIGAILAVLVFQEILIGEFGDGNPSVGIAILRTVLVGVLIGVFGELFLVQFLKRYWIPDHLQSPVTLMVVVTVFTLSEMVQIESGLLAVTLMGVFLANQKRVAVKHIIEFKENLRVLLISALFIVLAASFSVEDLKFIDGRALIFLAVLMLVVRPAAVLISTYGQKMKWQELVFLSWMAPRGIVAAVISSIFSFRLIEANHPQAEALTPITFFVIIGTVSIYGISISRLSLWLGLSQPRPQGVLIVGAHSWARQIAIKLQEAGVKVLMVDTNYRQILEAYEAGIKTHQGNIMAEHILDEIDLVGIGRFTAMTSNDKANSLAALHFASIFGRAESYQIPPEIEGYRGKEVVHAFHLRGRFLFGREITYSYLSRQFEAGAAIENFKLTEDFDYDDFKDCYDKAATPLFLVLEDGGLSAFTEDYKPTPRPGQILICLINPHGKDLKRCQDSISRATT